MPDTAAARCIDASALWYTTVVMVKGCKQVVWIDLRPDQTGPTSAEPLPRAPSAISDGIL